MTAQQTLVTEEFPKGLVDFVRKCVRLVDEGDPSIVMEYDHLLQSEDYQTSGGLVDVEAGRFLFSHCVNDCDEDGVNIEWEYEFNEQQLRDVAAARITHWDMWRCKERDCGRRFALADTYCPECDFEGDGGQRRDR